MKKEEIALRDVERILFGTAPATFLLEMMVRIVVVYLALLVTVRLLGRRMSAQLTILELAVMMALGAIVSVPFQIPERGILPAVALLLVVLLLQRGVASASARSPRAEQLTQGKCSALVEDGELVLDELRRAAVSREQLFAVLRSKGIHQLGQVKRVYLEACGLFSVLRRKEEEPGLSVVPPGDVPLIDPASGRRACTVCGAVREEVGAAPPCDRCGERAWTHATRGRTTHGDPAPPHAEAIA